ncbi:P-loop containing nucleoside triphosphate hydrolase protein [Sphaerosporella brunnea]|uniref:Gluconokinase n=1 Tax=Sphaerosporella brunnea TaxID=1250544 RepID=A0A5J5ECS6_9PEZI|nr:P-loop containing nucleoside triphosphate hydrolase protein [Sphaerosporella brunnea]
MLRKYESAAGSLLASPTTNTSPHNLGKVLSCASPKPARYIWIITGPAGCGKSSVARFLAKQLDLPYIEGDDYHPQSNIDKMTSGIPLTDDDRWDWLETIRNEAVRQLEGGAEGCVVTCSCLKRKYRDIIRVASREADDVVMRFVYLRADEKLLLSRVRARQGHYMKDDMVASQFAALEEPDETEQDVIPIDVSGTLDSVQSATMEQVQQIMDSHS